MKKASLLAIVVISSVLAAHPLTASTPDNAPTGHLSDWVSTLVGSQSDFSLSTGNTYPAIAVPWGMNFWTPMTASDEGDGWTYSYNAHKITGFKQTHQPSPWINDYAAFSVMAMTGDILGSDGKDRSASFFSHKSEVAKPYYYKVYLADHDVTVEIAPTERAAVMRITFPSSDASRVLVNAYEGGRITSADDNTIRGYTTWNHGGVTPLFRNSFYIMSDTSFEVGSVDGKRADVRFSTKRGQQVTLYMASSFISEEQALLNLKEVEGKTFDEVRDAAQARWDEMLGRIAVSGGTDDQFRTFYSCLYRSLLFPRKLYEIGEDGQPVHYSPYSGKVEKGYLYGDTGFWDTFRALFPLLNLAYPDINAEIQAGLASIARENAFLPEWSSPGHRDCMVGNNSASVVADAAILGINDNLDDLEKLYSTIVYGTEHVHPSVSSTGRKGYKYYNDLGYIPCNVGINENVARTLEYSYDDWCILQLAKKLGRPAKELAKWERRSHNWINVFDPETHLMRGRNADGTFETPFSPYKWGGSFTEGNAWHYTWSVFHDVPGLVEAMGGEDAFVEMLDSVMKVPPIYDDSYYGFRIHEITEMQVADMGNYAHGNQPAQHMLYLYDWAGQPRKTQMHVREVMDRLYSATPDGYCGDEDNGQTSAWYIFSALGFYPVCPASGQYAIGSPLFRHAVVSMPDGKSLVIDAPDNAPGHPYVSSVSLNGKTLRTNFLDIPTLKAGAKLKFDME